MKQHFRLLAAAAVLAGSVAQAQPTQILGPGLNSGRTIYHQNFTRTLSRDTTYILTGLYSVDSTFSITIPSGTIIKGDTAATLIIQRGAQVLANGTAVSPIVFTSNKPAGSRNGGDWGGIVILGAAPSNQSNPVIEGGILPGSYGGGAAGAGNPNDNSGVFRYVRIEYPGYRFQINNEVNGLTMGGVGRGTTIEYVQVSYSFDDGFEWFGGTVDARYLVCLGGIDDEFDTDFGYQGRVQFAFGLKDPNVFEFSGGQTNGFESDNEGSASYKEPRTLPRFSNITIVGPRRADAVTLPVGHRFEYCAVVRKGSQLSLYNSIVMGFPGGYSLRDAQSMTSAQGDTLQLRNVSLQSSGENGLLPVHSSGTPPAGFTASAWFNTAAYNNLGGTASRNPSAIGLVDMSNLNNPDPRPSAGSEPAISPVEFTNLNALAGGYFASTTYRGAFDPSLPLNQQWMAGWTNFDPQTSAYVTNVTSINNGWNLVSVPNVPASYATGTLFPGAVAGTVNSFVTGTYTQPSTLVNGEGYWAFYGAATSNAISGNTLSSASVTVASGNRWVLVGSVSTSVPASSLTSNPAGAIVGGTLNGWNGTAYSTPTTLEPGKGYWVFVNAPCTLTVGP